MPEEELKLNIDVVYEAMWLNFRKEPPPISPIDRATIARELDGRYSYEYVEGDGERVKGKFVANFPRWRWPTDRTRGILRVAGDKIVVIEQHSDKLRAAIVRSGSTWLLIQFDFPDGRVELRPFARKQ
jgi:hypothetical protein